MVHFGEVDLIRMDLPKKDGNQFGKTIATCHLFSQALPFILDSVENDTQVLSLIEISMSS